MINRRAYIIGSGIAGIAAAIRLASQGWQVTVLEKNMYPGGKLSHFTKGDYQFDAGPSLFTQPKNIEDLFDLCGEKTSDYFQYEPVSVACKYFFPNGKVINAYTDKQKFATEMQAVVGEPPSNILDYLKDAESCYQNIGELFVDYSLHKPKLFPFNRIISALGKTKLGYLFSSLHRYNTNRFSKAETVQMFNRYATYNGSNPYTAPGMLSLIPHLEQNEGTFYPKGGMISITNALVKLATKMKVNFIYGEEVTKIATTKNTASQVTTKSATYDCDIVVSNMDVYYTYKNLLNQERKAQKVLKQERSSSAFIFYWGINRSFDHLHLHNIFFTKDYQGEFDAIFNKKTLFDDPTIYINITSKMEESQAKKGCENWFVMINVPHHQGQDWDAQKVLAKEAILRKLHSMFGEDISQYIEEEEVLHPQLIESRTMSHTGSLYGSSSNSKMAAFLRHPNFTSSINNLYFVGGSVHPGGGIPLCLKSAKIAAEIIQTDFKNK
jgi:phytoene desaturase